MIDYSSKLSPEQDPLCGKIQSLTISANNPLIGRNYPKKSILLQNDLR